MALSPDNRAFFIIFGFLVIVNYIVFPALSEETIGILFLGLLAFGVYKVFLSPNKARLRENATFKSVAYHSLLLLLYVTFTLSIVWMQTNFLAGLVLMATSIVSAFFLRRNYRRKLHRP